MCELVEGSRSTAIGAGGAAGADGQENGASRVWPDCGSGPARPRPCVPGLVLRVVGDEIGGHVPGIADLQGYVGRLERGAQKKEILCWNSYSKRNDNSMCIAGARSGNCYVVIAEGNGHCCVGKYD